MGRKRHGIHVGGIPVHVPWTGIAGVALIAFVWLPALTWPGARDWQTYVVAAAFAALLYASVFGHELAHAAVARWMGFPVERIVLWALGGYTVYERRRPTPGREAAVAAAGPAMTVLIAVLLGAVGMVLDGTGPVQVLIDSLVIGNVFLAAYNLLPGLPLDGGAILRSIVWRLSGREAAGTIVAAWSGRGVAVFIMLSPFILAYWWGSEPSLDVVIVMAIFAAFTWIGATSSLRRGRLEAALPLLEAARLVRRTVPAHRDLPLSEALRLLDDAEAGGIIVVDHEGHPVGIVEEAAVAATPHQRRPWIPVSSVARTIDRESVIGVDAVGEDVLDALGDRTEVLVVDEAGRIAGIVSARDVEAALGG